MKKTTKKAKAKAKTETPTAAQLLESIFANETQLAFAVASYWRIPAQHFFANQKKLAVYARTRPPAFVAWMERNAEKIARAQWDKLEVPIRAAA